MKEKHIEKIEIDLFLEGVFHRYGYDFRHYSRASLKRRLFERMKKIGIESVSVYQKIVLYDQNEFAEFFNHMSINVTEMFRDPLFFRSLREKVVSILETYPYLKIWNAGCATGEETYSLAIILEEEGLLDRSVVYGTDFNATSIHTAQEGIYPAEKIKEFSENYIKAGGKGSFANYYHEKYNRIKLKDSLRKQLTFSEHNLVCDNSFGEMNLILCRNVLIYFDRILQDRTISLFLSSLTSRGFLFLGAKESLDLSSVSSSFEVVGAKEKIFRKKGLTFHANN